MGKVYRYIDIRDNFIKYVGIVYGENRTLEQRHREHIKNEIWCDENFKVQYLDIPVNNRSEAESLEAHFISLYKTGGWYIKSKSNWGKSSFIPEFNENDWQNFNYNLTSQDLENIKNKRMHLNKKITDDNFEKLDNIIEKLDLLIDINRELSVSTNRVIKYNLTEKINLLIEINRELSASTNRVIKYGLFTDIEEKIQNAIQETFVNEIDNIREKINVSFPEEINNKLEILANINKRLIDRISSLTNIEDKTRMGIIWKFSIILMFLLLLLAVVSKR